MVYDLLDTNCADDGEHPSTRESISPERSSPESFIPNPTCCEMSLPLLTTQCLRELDHYRRGEPCTEAYGLELLRRATIQDNQEENYVAQTFERFWQATAFNQRVEFSTLAAALQYLRASLHGVILDMLRAYARPREVSLPEPGEPGELLVEDSVDNSEDWEILHMILSNPREQRLTYLLFYCGLKPREILRFCPHEWSDVQEIYRLRRTILVRLFRNADQLRWRFNQGELL